MTDPLVPPPPDPHGNRDGADRDDELVNSFRQQVAAGTAAPTQNVVGLFSEAGQIVFGLLFGRRPRRARKVRSLDESRMRNREQSTTLRWVYAIGLLVILGAQIVSADVLVYLYASKGRHWDVPPQVIEAWLTATVVEVIGVVLVVTRYLFDESRD